MGHEIPTYLMLVPCDLGPPSRFTVWHDALPQLEAAAGAPGGFPALRDRGRLWELMSRNWWCEWMIVDAARVCGVSAVDFLRNEVTLLDAPALDRARTGLVRLLAGLEADVDLRSVPGFARAVDERHRDAHRMPEPLRAAGDDELLTVARQVAEPTSNLDCYGPSTLVDFFSFVLSLQVAVERALAERECLLHVRPNS